MRRLFEAINSQIRYKIILPYLALTLLVMTVGAAISTALVAASWEDRLQNELAQSGRTTSEALVLRERDILNYLFYAAFAQRNDLANAPSMADAITGNDPAVLARTLRPIYDYGLINLGLQFDRLIVFNRSSEALADWIVAPGNAAPIVVEGTNLSSVAAISDVLAGRLVDGNDKFSGLIVFSPDPQPYLYTVVPVRAGNTIVGGILVGTKVDRLIQQLEVNNRAAITTFYNSDGSAFGSTLVRREDELTTIRVPAAALTALQQGTAQSVFNVEVRSQDYLFAYSPLLIGGRPVGYFSVGLSRDFQVQNLLINRNLIVVITVVLAVLSVILGVWIASMINQPLKDLVETAEAVTAGNLELRSNLTGSDELGQLGQAFNKMTDHLFRLYRTSRDLGSTIDTEKVLAIATTTADSIIPGTEAVALLDERGTWRYALRDGFPEEMSSLQDIRLDTQHPLLLDVAHERLSQLITLQDERLKGTGLDALQMQSLMLTPLVLQDQTVGVLFLLHPEIHKFEGAPQPGLTAVSNMAASVLCNAVLFEQVNRENSERQAILRSIADGVVVCDQHGQIMLMNDTAERLLRLPDGNHQRRRFADLPLEQAQVSSDLFGVQNGAAHYQIGEKIVSLSSAPVIADDGRQLGMVNVLHDISVEAAVDRAKTAFIATISHELRTPLTVINGYTELLLRGIAGELSTDQRELLEQVRQRADHMANLFKNVVLVASIESNTLAIEIEPQQLRWSVERATNPMKHLFEKKSIELINQIPVDLPDVLADREHLQVILVQLLDNARRYTTQGKVVVDAQLIDQGSRIQIDICDTGSGIPAEEIARLFTRFHRVEGNNSPERGIGLGLAITKQLVERLGGTIWARSQVGSGSTFSFTLPVASGHADGKL